MRLPSNKFSRASSSRRSGAPSDPRSASQLITSRDNQHLKLFRAALRDGYLPAENLIAIEGPHLVEEALHSGSQIVTVLASPTADKFLDALPPTDRKELKLLRTTEKLFDQISGTEHPQGVAALIKPREYTLDDLTRGIPLIVALFGVQDPGNVGAAIRSAEAFGATGVVTTKGTADPWSAKAMRASAGSALRIPLLRGLSPAIALAQFRAAGLALIATTSKSSPSSASSSSPRTPNFRAPLALLIGNEGSGLPPEIRRSADSTFAIPMTGPVESLNAAIAASVILYEAQRQRLDGASAN
jgi:TrmH family RNA methyltransferase